MLFSTGKIENGHKESLMRFTYTLKTKTFQHTYSINLGTFFCIFGASKLIILKRLDINFSAINIDYNQQTYYRYRCVERKTASFILYFEEEEI